MFQRLPTVDRILLRVLEICFVLIIWMDIMICIYIYIWVSIYGLVGLLDYLDEQPSLLYICRNPSLCGWETLSAALWVHKSMYLCGYVCSTSFLKRWETKGYLRLMQKSWVKLIIRKDMYALWWSCGYWIFLLNVKTCFKWFGMPRVVTRPAYSWCCIST